MKNNQIIKSALINSISTTIYVILIASFIYFGGQSFLEGDQFVLIPIAMLMLFVFSVAFTGFLILGKPLTWYLNGKKKEAIKLFLYTLGIFLILTVIIFVLLIILIK